jgi:hypothetical protein
MARDRDLRAVRVASNAGFTRLILAAALAVVGVVLLSWSTGVAGTTNTVEIKSRIILRESFPAFHGRVKSPNQACVQQRRVKLFKRKPNCDRRLLGKTRTNAAGKWEVIVDPLSSGAYWAVVTRRSEGAAGTIFVCLRDKSKTVVVD